MIRKGEMVLKKKKSHLYCSRCETNGKWISFSGNKILLKSYFFLRYQPQIWNTTCLDLWLWIWRFAKNKFHIKIKKSILMHFSQTYFSTSTKLFFFYFSLKQTKLESALQNILQFKLEMSFSGLCSKSC